MHVRIKEEWKRLYSEKYRDDAMLVSGNQEHTLKGHVRVLTVGHTYLELQRKQTEDVIYDHLQEEWVTLNSPCPDCDGMMQWCPCCGMFNQTCCVEYGTCQCN